MENGLKKTSAIAALIVACLVLLGAIGGAFIKIGAAQERVDNLESAIVSVKAKQVEILNRIRNTELNTYAIAVKLDIQNIIKPLDQ